MRTTETSKTVRRLADQGHLIGERWVASDAGGTHPHRNPPPVRCRLMSAWPPATTSTTP